MLRTRHLIITFIQANDATVKTFPSLHDLDDLHEGDLMRWASAGEPAAAAFGAAEDAAFDELLEKLGDEVTGQIGAGDELIQQHRLPVLRAAGEFRQAANGIFSGVGKDHEKSAPIFGELYLLIRDNVNERALITFVTRRVELALCRHV